jgi:beta-lactam-binding protein with PASTA domain
MTHYLKHFIWILPFAFFLGGYSLVSLLLSSDALETPSLIGKNMHDALSILSKHNLNARIITHKEDADLEPGTIINQIPQPGTKIKPNQSMYLTTSIKPATKNAPQFVHGDLKTIEQEAKNAGLVLKTYTLHSNFPKNTCFAQSPTAGTAIKNPTIIAYISSDTHKPVLVPNFKGKSLASVLEFLEMHDIKSNIIYPQQETDVPHNKEYTVTDQRPLPGSFVQLNAEKPLVMQLQVQES